MTNNAIINNYGRLQGLIFPSKIPTDKHEIFFEIYRQFGQARSKFFVRPGLDQVGLSSVVVRIE